MSYATKYIVAMAILLASFYFLCEWSTSPAQPKPPYPPSPVIENITWDFANAVRLAPGSDLWPVTWAADGHLYTSWGDGGGFGGNNSDGRVSLGFGRIEGPPDNLLEGPGGNVFNVWGGKNAQNPTQFGGKGIGMISVDGTLYAWINIQDGSPPSIQLAWSSDLGVTWQRVVWKFPGQEGKFFPNTFLNFGNSLFNE